MEHHTLPLGTVLADEYRIDAKLGEGGFGLTYLGWDLRLNVKVAIKEYLPSDFAMRVDGSTVVAKSESMEPDYQWGLQSFLKEARALAKYRDNNIVNILRFFEANGTAYIVMEYCDGGSLAERIKDGTTLNELELKSILVPIMNSLQLVHDDEVYHRDIKPENIMFRGDGTPILIDFGAARQAVGSKTRTASSMCTPPYAAWEQYQTGGHVGPWTDIYGLSAVAYECLTGEPPLESSKRIPKDGLVCLAKEPGSSQFRRALDWGLGVFEESRPQNLAEWYAAFDEEDYSQLDVLIELAGSDGLITQDEMAFILSQSESMGCEQSALQAYVLDYAKQKGWEVTDEAASAVEDENGAMVEEVPDIETESIALFPEHKPETEDPETPPESKLPDKSVSYGVSNKKLLVLFVVVVFLTSPVIIGLVFEVQQSERATAENLEDLAQQNDEAKKQRQEAEERKRQEELGRKEAEREKLVIEIKRLLASLGYQIESPDSKLDQQTENAIREFRDQYFIKAEKQGLFSDDLFDDLKKKSTKPSDTLIGLLNMQLAANNMSNSRLFMEYTNVALELNSPEAFSDMAAIYLLNMFPDIPGNTEKGMRLINQGKAIGNLDSYAFEAWYKYLNMTRFDTEAYFFASESARRKINERGYLESVDEIRQIRSGLINNCSSNFNCQFLLGVISREGYYPILCPLRIGGNCPLTYDEDYQDNREEAVKWFRKAAKSGHPEAIIELEKLGATVNEN